MASNSQILSKARELGQLLGKSDAAGKLEDVTNRLQEDVEAQRLLNDYRRLATQLVEKQSQGQQPTEEQAQRFEQLRNQIARTPLLRDLQMAQMDWADLMRQVDEAIAGQSPDQAAEAPNPGMPAAPGSPGGAPIFNPNAGGNA